MIKIAHLTSAHPRYDTRIFIKMCSSLAAQYDVFLVVADGLGDEIKNKVNITDVGERTGGRLSRMTKTVNKVFKKAIELDADVYHFHDPELMPTGLKLKKMGKKVIFDIHENTDLQILEKKWIPVVFRKVISIIFRTYEDYACKKFDLLIVPQEAMFKKFNILKKTIVIGNFPNKINNINLNEKKINKYRLLYSGLVTESRGLLNMLNLINSLVKLDKKYTLTIAGSISDELLKQVKYHEGWKYTKYLGFLSKEEIYEIYDNNSIGLILFNNVGQYYMAYSLKLFEYMQNGMVVVMPDFGDWLGFNEENNVGFNFPTNDYSKISNEINKLTIRELMEFAVNNIKLVNNKFSWESEENKLFKLYEELINAN
jgi:glycosyltransferase involved in cell wall biosynthesis